MEKDVPEYLRGLRFPHLPVFAFVAPDQHGGGGLAREVGKTKLATYGGGEVFFFFLFLPQIHTFIRVWMVMAHLAARNRPSDPV